MAKHAHLAPSACTRWWNCPGSVVLSKTVPPSPTSVYAAEGTAFHSFCEEAYKAGKVDTFAVGEVIEVDGFNITIQEDWVEYAQQYLDLVWDLEKQYGVKAELEVKAESPVEGVYGTCDCVIYVPFEKLIIIDIKFGAGVAVEVLDNKQLLCYASGAAVGRHFEDLDIVVFQPRKDHPNGTTRVWQTTREYLREWEVDLQRAAERTEVSEPEFHDGDHCRWCPAAQKCPLVGKKVNSLAKTVFGSGTIEQTCQEVASILNKAELVKKIIANAEEKAMELAQQGYEIPGFQLERTWGNRKWASEKTFVEFCKENNYECYETKVVTPAKFEKINKGVDTSPFVVRKESQKLKRKKLGGVALDKNKEAAGIFS